MKRLESVVKGSHILAEKHLHDGDVLVTSSVALLLLLISGSRGLVQISGLWARNTEEHGPSRG
jgi:hypothetical protein